MNGEMKGFFPLGKGVLGRGPWVPHLFLLIIEAFLAILQSNKSAAINLSHIVFVDDMFIMCGAITDTFDTVAGLLEDFHVFSGQQPNLSESACFFAGVSDDLKQELRAILDIAEAALPVRYLGVPLISTTLKHADYVIFKDRIWKRGEKPTRGGRGKLGRVNGGNKEGVTDSDAGDEPAHHQEGVVGGEAHEDGSDEEDGGRDHDRVPAAHPVGGPAGGISAEEGVELDDSHDDFQLDVGDFEIVLDEGSGPTHHPNICISFLRNVS
ncbi:hypothetical protein RHMOL_Rhmol05G0088600 [Rhododendron molle]|uniref:Uncharacterized protein n=1 Tax=Rhododendron molle TaxID=49168 RepID=A0ACC0NNY5_RHOML|nr:hypothetical protein RHMOL_Rhmol05G0088600 [Rhododendron molle]